jgi:hypothetical protein
MRSFFPVGEAAQADYEELRAAVLAGTPAATPAAARFARGGLAALIARPVAEPVLLAVLHGAPRHPWSAHSDPRLEALTAGFELLLACTDTAGGTSVSAAGSSP